MRILLTGGGTSGHVNPALAIADIIKAKHPDAYFGYIGTEKGIEKRLVEKEGYEYHSIKIQGIQRSLSPKNIKAAYFIMRAPAKAKKIIEKFKPDIVIGTGGYVCWAPLKAAAEMGIPTVVHESNSIPGLAVRKLENKVDLILTNFKSTEEKLTQKQKVVHVGNPIRASFEGISKEEARKKLGIPDEIKFVILSFGGSLGAPGLNEAAITVMKDFSLSHKDVMHFHAGGRNYYKNAMQMFSGYDLEKNPRLDLREYIYDMNLYMTAADLVICRAGAMTLTELAMMKKPAILIPSPFVAENHQYKNALSLAQSGAAVLIEQNTISDGKIIEQVEKIYSDAALRKDMADKISQFSNPDVDTAIYGVINGLISGREKIKKK